MAGGGAVAHAGPGLVGPRGGGGPGAQRGRARLGGPPDAARPVRGSPLGARRVPQLAAGLHADAEARAEDRDRPGLPRESVRGSAAGAPGPGRGALRQDLAQARGRGPGRAGEAQDPVHPVRPGRPAAAPAAGAGAGAGWREGGADLQESEQGLQGGHRAGRRRGGPEPPGEGPGGPRGRPLRQVVVRPGGGRGPDGTQAGGDCRPQGPRRRPLHRGAAPGAEETGVTTRQEEGRVPAGH